MTAKTDSPRRRRQILVAVIILGICMLVGYVLSKPLDWRYGDQPGETVLRGGTASITSCSTGMWQAWMLYTCRGFVRWDESPDIEGHFDNIKAARSLSGTVDVVERIEQSGRRGGGAVSRKVIVPTDQPVGGNSWWRLPLWVVICAGLPLLGYWLAGRGGGRQPSAPATHDWKSKMHNKHEKRRRFNGPRAGKRR